MRCSPGHLRLAGVLLGLCAFSAVAPATQYSIPIDFPTIQAGIDACQSGDTVLVAYATYSGPGNVNLDFHGLDIVLRGEWGGDWRPVLDGVGGSTRALRLISGEGEGAIIERFVIRNFRPAYGDGCAVYCVNSSPVLRELLIEDCGEEWFSDIILGVGTLYASGSARPRLEDCEFRDCSRAWGGAVYLAPGAALLCERTRFDGCYAIDGGGVFASTGSGLLEVDDCEFVECRAAGVWGEYEFYGGDGGAIYCRGSLAISGTDFLGCRALYGSETDSGGSGGAVFLWGGAGTIEDGYVDGGSGYRGSAVYSGTALSLSGMTAHGGAGGLSVCHVAAGSLSLDRCLIAEHAGSGVHVAAGVLTATCTNVWGNAGGNYTGAVVDPTGTDGNISADPRFCTALHNPDQPLALDADSPCLPYHNGCGVLIGHFGAACDMPGDGESPHRVPSEFASIALALEVCAPGDTILVAPGEYAGAGFRNLDWGDLDLTLLSEAGAESTLIDLEQETRFLRMQGAGAGESVQGFTLRNGWVNGTDPGGGRGGALCLENSAPLLRDLVIEDCTAQTAEGGAIYALNAGFRLEGARLTGNAALAGPGGGLYIQGASAPELDHVVLQANTAAGNGGGIALSAGAQPRLRQVTLHGNRSDAAGGALHAQGGSAADLAGLLVTLNVATQAGGGLHVVDTGSLPALSCSNLFGNTPGNYGGALADQTGMNGNLSAWPAYCDLALPDLRLLADSPCLPANNACGVLMGALGACESTAVPPPPAAALALSAHPNPFNPVTTLRLALAAPGAAELRVFDLAGRCLATPLSGELPAGETLLRWEARDAAGRALPSGVYLIELRTGCEQRRLKLLLLK